ncbi:hypothetical protein RFI_02822 [Reticulomyxa filosa]|uniref:Uncharacterized protein n=1 Tax=Reticulomyxa filosa TaxID=46433 RepID=X6P874_RETFI|nr:hypothetical protein RFI_02822 [Reticulomyxa filosa]|eukprot:ETO34274.1 hypothetical protein RFI_02822 [Reticulomyxa filosa]
MKSKSTQIFIRPFMFLARIKCIKMLTFRTFERLDEQWKIIHLIFFYCSPNCDKVIIRTNCIFLQNNEKTLNKALNSMIQYGNKPQTIDWNCLKWVLYLNYSFPIILSKLEIKTNKFLLTPKKSKNTKKLEVIPVLTKEFFPIEKKYHLCACINNGCHCDLLRHKVLIVNIVSLQKIHFNFLLTFRGLEKNASFHHQSSSQGKKGDTLISSSHFALCLEQSKEEEIQIIVHYWIRTLNIQLGWIKDFDKLVVQLC